MPKVSKQKSNTNSKQSETVADGEILLAPKPCDRCRKHRIRCDRNAEQCQNCKKKDLNCTYLDIPKKRGPKPKALSVGDVTANETETNDCSVSSSVSSSDNLYESQMNSPIASGTDIEEENTSSINSPNLSDMVIGANELLYNEQLYYQQPVTTTAATNQLDQFSNLCYTTYTPSLPSYIEEFQPAMTYPQNIYKQQEQQNLYDCSWSNSIYNQYPLPFDMTTQYYPLYANTNDYLPLQSDLWLTIPNINQQQQLNSGDSCNNNQDLAGLSPLLL